MWMSLDVHFSTVSTLHLCCIAVDRYFAIVRPLKYTTYMTVKVAACMIAVAWTAPIVISFLPIFLGWNTTQDHIDWRELHQDECILRVIYHSNRMLDLLRKYNPVLLSNLKLQAFSQFRCN